MLALNEDNSIRQRIYEQVLGKPQIDENTWIRTLWLIWIIRASVWKLTWNNVLLNKESYVINEYFTRRTMIQMDIDNYDGLSFIYYWAPYVWWFGLVKYIYIWMMNQWIDDCCYHTYGLVWWPSTRVATVWLVTGLCVVAWVKVAKLCMGKVGGYSTFGWKPIKESPLEAWLWVRGLQSFPG